MQKRILLSRLCLTLAAAIVLISCESEKFAVAKSSIIKKSNSEISFSEFKKETKLTDFKTTIKITSPSQTFARNADGSYELSDFDIDTDIIKRLELDDKITYTFRIYPKVVIAPTSFYNLTMDYKDGEWIQNVVELKPTLENFDNLIGGSTNDINGEMSILFTSNSNGLNTANNCYSVGIISNNCGSPEISETCVSKKYGTFCFDNENNVLLGEKSNIFNDADSTDLDYSFILNTNDLKKNLTIFARNHVLINNQILNLIQNEKDANFDDFPVDELTSTQNLEEFKRALANSGIIKYEELGDLMVNLVQNARNFVSNNKDFTILKEETKQILIGDAIDDALTENPINWPPVDPGNTTQMRTCAQQFTVDQNRCNQQNNIHGAEVLVACISTWWSGPLGCGAAAMIALYSNKVCQQNAREDYNDCIK